MRTLVLSLMILLLLPPTLVACCDESDDKSMELHGTLTVVNETNPPVDETQSQVDKLGVSVDAPLSDTPAPSVLGATSGTGVLYTVNIYFTIVSNINVSFTSDEAGQSPFHTVYWNDVARGSNTVNINFWAHNMGEEVTFHSDISCQYLTLTPPLDVTLAQGESQEFMLILSIPIDAPLGDQECTIKFVEGSFMG